PKPRCRRYVVARGRTGTNVPVLGGGMLRAGNQDVPDWFDQGAWDTYVADGVGGFPRSPATARNFYGPKANCLAIVLELPSARIAPNGSVLAVWARSIAAGGRMDREGKPFVNTGMIPKTPRNSSAPERRDAFNLALLQNDVSAFKPDMITVLTGFYGRTNADATFLANAFLPDVLFFQIGNPNGFGTTIGPGNFPGPFPGSQSLGNGRRFADDVHDIMLNLLT